MDQIRISGKNLGQLALDSFCPRCFWIKLKCQNKLPFQIFPGIFSSIDSYTKRVVIAHYEKHGRVPDWLEPFGPLGEPLPIPHHSKFQTLDTKTNVLLTGVPDLLFRRPDGTLVILDNKTARFTENQDDLLPLYRVQLNSYGYIAKRIGLGSVSGLGLVYFEPQTEVDTRNIDSVVLKNGFAMGFTAKLLPLRLEPKKVPPLLRKVRAIYDQPHPPFGKPGCKDCQLLGKLVESGICQEARDAVRYPTAFSWPVGLNSPNDIHFRRSIGCSLERWYLSASLPFGFREVRLSIPQLSGSLCLRCSRGLRL